MFKSIRSKLVTSFLISISISIVIMAIIMSQIMGRSMKQDFINSTKNEMNKVEEIVNVFFSEMKNNGQMLAENEVVKRADESITNYTNATDPSGEIPLTPIQNGGVESEMYYVYENFAKTHSNTADVFFGSVGGAYIQYANGNVKNNYDPRERPWYKEAIENDGEVIVTDAYYWEGADAVNVSVVTPVKNNSGDTIGVQAIDVSLNGLTDMISELKMGDNGYIIIVEPTGNILSHPAKPDLNFKNINDTYLSQLGDKDKGSVEFNDEGKDYITNIHTSDINGWKFISVVPKSELLQKTRVINSSILMLGLIIMIISVAVSIFISRGISAPIQNIRDLMKQVESGNFNVISNIKGKDEVADLSNSFNNMTQNIKGLIESSKYISVDITDSADVLTDMSEQISLSSEEITHAISELASETFEQAKNTDGIVESIEEITSDIELVSTIIDDKTESAKQLATDGIETVNSLEDVTKRTVDSSKQVSNAVNLLNEKSSNIGEIINMIKHVSDETSLLALNASIEAARAGESGRGFAVVATEIGKLAEESKKSTDNIENIIREIQEEIEKAVFAMDESSKLVEENESIVNDSQRAFKTIVEIIDDIKTETMSLNSSLEKMDYEKEQTADAINRISVSAQQTAATSEEITASSEEQTSSIYRMSESIKNLRDLSNELKSSISRFEI